MLLKPEGNDGSHCHHGFAATFRLQLQAPKPAPVLKLHRYKYRPINASHGLAPHGQTGLLYPVGQVHPLQSLGRTTERDPHPVTTELRLRLKSTRMSTNFCRLPQLLRGSPFRCPSGLPHRSREASRRCRPHSPRSRTNPSRTSEPPPCRILRRRENIGAGAKQRVLRWSRDWWKPVFSVVGVAVGVVVGGGFVELPLS